MLNVYVLPKWGKAKVGEIKRRDLVLLLDDIDAPIQANRVLALVRKMFNFAIDRGILEATPFTRMKPPHEEKERGRTLPPDEIKAFWNGLDKANIENHTRLALKFLLVTAQRSIEVSDAARSEIDLHKRIWIIPASRTKNGYEHRLPLPDLAVELLGETYALGGDSAYVFPDKKNGTKSMHQGSLRQAVSRNLAVFGIPHFTPHDLRRTASTMMRALIPGKGVRLSCFLPAWTMTGPSVGRATARDPDSGRRGTLALFFPGPTSRTHARRLRRSTRRSAPKLPSRSHHCGCSSRRAPRARRWSGGTG